MAIPRGSCPAIEGKDCRPYAALFNRCKREANSVTSWRRFGRVWTITYEEFLKFIEIKVCHYCGVDIHWPLPHGKRDALGKARYGSNLDRVNNTKDYSAENCKVACWECNRTRRDLLSYEEMKIVGKLRQEIREKNDGC